MVEHESGVTKVLGLNLACVINLFYTHTPKWGLDVEKKMDSSSVKWGSDEDSDTVIFF